jgi:hypothetical protein
MELAAKLREIETLRAAAAALPAEPTPNLLDMDKKEQQ